MVPLLWFFLRHLVVEQYFCLELGLYYDSFLLHEGAGLFPAILRSEILFDPECYEQAFRCPPKHDIS